MPLLALGRRDRDRLRELFFRLHGIAQAHPAAAEESRTALRLLKAVHSNFLEDRRIDRIFLQVLLHGAGVSDKRRLGPRYAKVSDELRGQEAMILLAEEEAGRAEPFSISQLLGWHRAMLGASVPDMAGRFRGTDVRIQDMPHRPPHHSRLPELAHQHCACLNEGLAAAGPLRPESFFEYMRLSAEAHYRVAHLHPFQDGNGRVARTAGDYVLLRAGMFYDVIMSDYRDAYLEALDESSEADVSPLVDFLLYSYFETLTRIRSFFEMVERDAGAARR